MLKKCGIILITGLLMLLLCCPAAASAADVKAVLYDEGARLSTSEYNECLARLQQAADATSMNIGVVLGVQNRSDITIESIAKSSYIELFGENSDGLLYYMDLKGHEPYDYIATRGMAQLYYTNSDRNNRIDSIYNALDDYLYPVGNEDVRGAVLAFAEEVEYYYNAGVPDHYYYYDDQYKMYYSLDEDGKIRTTVNKPYRDWGVVVIFSFMGFLIGFVAAVITFFVIKIRYKFKYSLSPTTYVNRKSVIFHQQYDKFIRTHTSKVYINSSSGGGHSSGGGGGLSSGGFGGGGHHR